MAKSNHVGYHTCKIDNGFDYILNNIPFQSGNGPNQWLTEGYYFWTDSDFWAKKWGKIGKRVIGKFDIELCFQDEVLDLVGNVKHQEEFVKLKNLILKNLSKSQQCKITVNQIIKKLRNTNGAFPYLAIKAEDGRKIETINFVDPQINRTKINLITPQQLCVFEQAADRIAFVGFVEPQEYVEKISAEL